MKTQQRRLRTIEKHLLRRIEDILPADSDLMTATELVQVCQRLHTVNLGFAHHLQSIAGHRSNGENVPNANNSCDAASVNGHISLSRVHDLDEVPPVRFSTGGPLNSVVEADYETDATTTPASTTMTPNTATARANPGQASTPSATR